MQAHSVLVYLSVSFFAFFIQSADNNQKNIIVITPDFITTPNDTSVNSFSLSSIKTIGSLGFWSMLKFGQVARYQSKIHADGEKIAKEIPGTALAVRQLFEKVEKDYKFEKFTDPELKALINIAVQPKKKNEAFDLLKKLKADNYIICVTAHDTEEQLFFEEYLSKKYKTQLSDYVHAVITIPGYRYSITEKLFSYYENLNRWLVAHTFTPASYQAALDEILKDKRGSCIIVEKHDTSCLHNPLNLLSIENAVRLNSESFLQSKTVAFSVAAKK